MGLAASQARLLMLTALKSDYEFHLQIINQGRMQLANMMSYMFTTQSNLDPGSPRATQLQSDLGAIQMRDKQFELESNRIKTVHQATQTEIESVQQIIKKNIEMSFKLMG